MAETMDLAVFDFIKKELAVLAEKDARLVFDHTTEDGEKGLRSYVARLRGHKGDLKRIKDDAKREALVYGNKVQGIFNELTEGVQKIIDARMKPLDDIENAKRSKAEAVVEAERVAAEKVEADKLADLKRREAEVARKEAEIKVAEDTANAEQQAADRVVREKHIADEAAETAKKLAEANAAKQAEALKKSIQDNADRRERIRLDEIEDKAAVARMDAEVERRRVANRTHRSKIDAAVEMALRGIGIGDDAAHEVTTALVQNKIPNVTIKY